MSRKGKGDVKVAGDAQVDDGRVYVVRMAWRLSPPWIAAVGLFLLGGLGHLVWGDPAIVPWATGFLGASTTALAVLTVVAGRTRGPIVRVLGSLTVVLIGLWLIVSAVTGFAAWWAYLLVMLLPCAAWTVRRLFLVTTPADQQTMGAWGDLRDKVQILKAQVLSERREGASQKVRLELPPGVTQQAVAGDGPVLAGLFDTPAGGVQVVADPDRAREVELVITPEDILKVTIRWPGPSAPGTSIADAPVRLGDYQDGQAYGLTLPGVRGVRVVSHVLLMGMSGAGKSEGLQVFCAEVLTRIDTELEYLDVGGKAEQTIKPLKSGIRRLSTEDKAARQHLKDLIGEIGRRAKHLGDRGLAEWVKGCGLSFKVVVIDEGADLVAGSPAFTELARKARSVGILLVLAIQRATHNQMPTEARANFGTVICFGVRRPDDAGFALSDETLEAGANPSAWANRKPGYSYLEDNGIDPMRFSMPARFYLAAPDDVELVVRKCAGIRWAGEPYVAVPAPRVEQVVDQAAQAQRSARGDDVVDAQEVTPDEEDAAMTAEVKRKGYQVPPDMKRELDQMDPDADITEQDAGALDLDAQLAPTPGKRLRLEAAVAQLDQLLAEIKGEGVAEFQRSDLIARGALTKCDRGKAWLSDQLGKRVDGGVLFDVTGDRADGVYGWADALTPA